jgi:hypothetical protein
MPVENGFYYATPLSFHPTAGLTGQTITLVGSDQILLKFLHCFRIYGSTVPFNLDYFQFCRTRIMGLDPMKIVNVLHAFSSVLWTIFFKLYLPDYKEWWSESLYTFWGIKQNQQSFFLDIV